MDLHLRDLRYFLVLAEELNFTRAALRLHIAQPTLTRQVARLEAQLGIQLVDRSRPAIALTAAGERLKAEGGGLLAAWDSVHAAVTAAAEPRAPLRVDVWVPQHPYEELLDAFATGGPVEVSMRRNLPAAVEALVGHQVDVVFGRLTGLPGPWPAALERRPIRLARTHVVVSTGHRLARARTVRLADLAPQGFWRPDGGPSMPEVADWMRQVSETFGVALRQCGPSLGLEHTVRTVEADPTLAMLLPAAAPLPTGVAVVALPVVDPAPCWLTSIAWRHDDPNPDLRRLLALVADTDRMTFDPAADWLPQADAALLKTRGPQAS